ncbi:hypothetical protein ACFLXB_06710 [Chloroflexota bacterium]
MKISTNSKLIKRNARIGQITSITALVILGIGMYITFQRPELFSYSLLALIVGFFLSQIGMYYGNRWGRRPRPDEILDKSLKGIGRDHTMYHYSSPTPHLLVGPSGIWVLLHYYQGGNISFEKKKWRQKGGGFVQGYLKIFGQENIGKPDVEAANEVNAFRKFLKKELPELENIEIFTAAIFSNANVSLDTEGAPISAYTPKEFKDLVKKKAKENPVSGSTIKLIQNTLPAPESNKKKQQE